MPQQAKLVAIFLGLGAVGSYDRMILFLPLGIRTLAVVRFIAGWEYTAYDDARADEQYYFFHIYCNAFCLCFLNSSQM